MFTKWIIFGITLQGWTKLRKFAVVIRLLLSERLAITVGAKEVVILEGVGCIF